MYHVDVYCPSAPGILGDHEGIAHVAEVEFSLLRELGPWVEESIADGWDGVDHFLVQGFMYEVQDIRTEVKLENVSSIGRSMFIELHVTAKHISTGGLDRHEQWIWKPSDIGGDILSDAVLSDEFEYEETYSGPNPQQFTVRYRRAKPASGQEAAFLFHPHDPRNTQYK